MPIHIGAISKQTKPKFVSKRKREQLKSLSLQKPALDLPKAPEESHEPEVASVEIPKWRLEPEEPEESQPLVEQSIWEKPRDTLTAKDWKIICKDYDLTYEPEIEARPLRNWQDAEIKGIKFVSPTSIQAAAVPLLLQGRNVVGISPTGSGKTLAFCVPVKMNLAKTLVLSPTRELAMQTAAQLASLNVTNACVVGGRDFEAQIDAVTANPTAIVATPGRLIDLIDQKIVDLSDLKYLVIDEADRMLEQGFGPQLDRIREQIPRVIHTALFSATWTVETQRIGKEFAPSLILIRVRTTLNTSVKQKFEYLNAEQKKAAIKELLPAGRCIVFANQKTTCDELEKIIPCVVIHSGKSQAVRENSLAQFRAGKFKVLVATDVVGRGIDIPQVDAVVNYDMPKQIESYVHRVGRTGRAGAQGLSVTFVTDKDKHLFPDLRKLLRAAGLPVPAALLSDT